MGGGGGSLCCVGNCCIGNCCITKVIKDIFCSDSCCVGNRSKDTESYDKENADIQMTLKVQQSLTEYKTDAQSRCAKLENEVIKESREHLDSFIDDLRKYNNQIRYGRRRLNINISNIERENRKTEDKIHGFIVKRVIKRVSLDDDECTEILKMDKGDAKKEKFNVFYRKVLKEAVEELTKELQTGMEENTDRVCDTIQRRIDSIVDVCESKTEEFENIRKVKEKDEAAVEQEQLRLTHFVAMCEYGLNLLD